MPPSLSAEPYLSVVVVSRNDDHGGDPLKRLQAFVNTFDAQCRQSGLDAELIVVEWNPPADRPRLHELVRVPPACAFVIRFIEVPPHLHERIPFGDVLPLFQMIAKNVGIRRARGRFVLSTNIDIIFSNELVQFLASKQLSSDRRYRVDRHDIEPDYPVGGALEAQMAYCASHQLRLHACTGTQHVDRSGHLQLLPQDIGEASSISLVDGWHVREGDSTSGFYRWVCEQARFRIDRSAEPALSRGVILDLELSPNPYQPDSWVEVEVLDRGRPIGRARLSRRMTLWIALEDEALAHDIVLRMIDSSGGRECLPLFERREHLCYRVYRVRLTSQPHHPYPMSPWERAADSSLLSVERRGSHVAITTDPARYSYAVRYAQFEAKVEGTYEFLLEYEEGEGRFELTAMDDDQVKWLPVRAADIYDGAHPRYYLSVTVPAGMKFSLYVSNHLPEGDAVSRFVLRSLTGSVPFEQLAREPREPLAASMSQIRAKASVLARPLKALRSRASSVAMEQARDRYGERLVGDSERIRELEARVRELLPLQELAPIAQFLRDQRPKGLHQNASGDFQLLAREHWFELRGFAEFATYSMNIDGLFESSSDAAGIEEQVLAMPLCIYHLEHEKGSGWTPEGEALLKKRMADSGITWLDARAVHIWTAYMQWLRRPMIFNGADWGLGDAMLRETVVTAAAVSS